MTKPKIDLVLFHADWCGHCVRFKPDWDKIKNTKFDNINVKFHDVEASNIDNKATGITKPFIGSTKIGGFPTIKTTIKYDKDYAEFDLTDSKSYIKQNLNIKRNKEDILGFLNKLDSLVKKN